MAKTIENLPVPILAAKQRLLFAASLAFTLTALLSTGCGKQAYQVTASQDEQQAPGSFTIPAKVDILLVEDDTGSMRESFAQISQEMPAFLNALTGRGWDYHFATVPLTAFRPVTQVQASRYDVNWGTQWIPQIPGTPQPTTGQVASWAFRLPLDYTGFLTGYELGNNSGGERGFANLVTHLSDASMTGTGFLRQDAMLAVLVVGNGDDTSDLNICTRNDGWTGACSLPEAGYPYTLPCGSPGALRAPNCNNDISTFNTFKAQLQGIKKAASLLKFYAAVSPQRFVYNTLGCMAGTTYAGTRYMRMASDLGGKSFDICNQSIQQILDSMSGHLQSIKDTLRTRYLFVSQEPRVETIKVWRNPGGNRANHVAVPRDTAHKNGWDYAGHVDNVFTIDYPSEMNQASGWAIELFGSAKLTGGDTATVESAPAAAQDSVAK